MFIDTHCHLSTMDKIEFDKILSEDKFFEIDKVLENSLNAGVAKIITIGTSLIESMNACTIAKRYENVFATVGIHPSDLSDNWREDLKDIENLIKDKEQNKIVAVGEIGLDYFRKQYDFFHNEFGKAKQSDAFKAQIEMALKYNLPIVIHSRDASEDLLKILEEYKKELRGVLHCFSHEKYFAEIICEWGFYFGINGLITYPKNNEIREIVSNLPLDRILLETDAPFLPPQNLRGQKNYPSYIPMFAQTIAELKKITLSELEQVTTKNAEKLFGI